jgi:hypothetical protein
MFAQVAINKVTMNVWNNHSQRYIPNVLTQPSQQPAMPDIKPFCVHIVHPKTGNGITKYAKLAEDVNPELCKTWQNGMGKEFGNMVQGDEKTGRPGINALFLLDHKQSTKTTTHARLIVDVCPQKKDRNRIHMTAGGNLIHHTSKLTMRTACLTTAKILWNSVLSTEGMKYECFDISNMYLKMPLDPKITSTRASC